MVKSATARIGEADPEIKKLLSPKAAKCLGNAISQVPEVEPTRYKSEVTAGDDGRCKHSATVPQTVSAPSSADRSVAYGERLPKIVSLFAGAGGLDRGFKDAGFQIAVAFDVSKAAIRTHQRNFPETASTVIDLVGVQPSGVVDLVKETVSPGERIGVIGGPPCQGFSRANTTAQQDDPRNKLPDIYLKILAELQSTYTVDFFVFENVLGFGDKKHSSIYQALTGGLEALGFTTSRMDLCALDFGVPQNRQRIVMAGMRCGQGYSEVRPRKRKGKTTVREAIGGLRPPVFYQRGLSPQEFPEHPNHWTMKPKSIQFSNPRVTTVDGRSFKRLDWQKASPTIAFGHREIYVHPNGDRRLSLYEAMRLQGFPHDFVLEGNLSEQVEQVSNAVPPPLARSIALAVKRALVGQ
jgi:DNA (cytosine-5)-methyltransferase 1